MNDQNAVLVIAEIGVNHNGDVITARQLVDAAAGTGADVVKFQTFTASRLVAPHAAAAAYQTRNTGLTQTQREMLRRLELREDELESLHAHSLSLGVEFLSTGFDIEDVAMLQRIGIRRIKIPSGEITNHPLLSYVARQGLPVIMSTGMSTLDECREALTVLLEGGMTTDQVTLLQCTSTYPAPVELINLRAIETLRRELGIRVGLSDHSSSTVVPAAAVALGASVIEKHITLDRSMPGPDHAASLEPDEFSAMVRNIREVEVALGDGTKHPTAPEMETRFLARRSIAFKEKIRAGTVIEGRHLTTRRPADGISPMEWWSVISTTAARDFDIGELFER